MTHFDERWCPKVLREKLCIQQTFAPDLRTCDAIQSLVEILDEHRPLGSSGKHGEMHTLTCGCEESE